jgi:hypothetical protein
MDRIENALEQLATLGALGTYSQDTPGRRATLWSTLGTQPQQAE